MIPYEGHEWKVADFTWERKEFSWSTFKYPAVIYSVELHRQPTYYRHIFVIPSFLVAMLTVFLFLIPPDAGERIALGECESLILCAGFCLSQIFFFYYFDA